MPTGAQSEFSAGGVVVREGECIVIVPTRRAADGSKVLALPKGHPDGRESAADAALREGREETGVEARLVEKLGDVRYWYMRGGRRIAKVVSFFLLDYLSRELGDPDHEVEHAEWMALEDAARRLTYQGERDMAAAAERVLSRRGKPQEGAARHAGPELLLDDLRRPAQAGAQDGDDPPRRQVAQVQEEPGRAGDDRLSALAAREDLRGGHRPGRRQARQGPVAAGHRARQPRVPPPRRDDPLPRADLRARGVDGGHSPSGALRADHRAPAERHRRAAGHRRRAELSRSPDRIVGTRLTRVPIRSCLPRRTFYTGAQSLAL